MIAEDFNFGARHQRLIGGGACLREPHAERREQQRKGEHGSSKQLGSRAHGFEAGVPDGSLAPVFTVASKVPSNG